MCSLLKSLKIHYHGSFHPCTVESTYMTILWCGKPHHGQLFEEHTPREQRVSSPSEVGRRLWLVGDTWDYLKCLSAKVSVQFCCDLRDPEVWFCSIYLFHFIFWFGAPPHAITAQDCGHPQKRCLCGVIKKCFIADKPLGWICDIHESWL